MATSAIGPGFLTQTAAFTADLKASFGFVIFISVLLDIGAQLNIWRIVSVSGLRAQNIAALLLPGGGWLLATLIGFGGLVFNVGNIAGCGLGLQALTGLPTAYGALLSCVATLAIFWVKEAGPVMDRTTRVLGVLMILFTAYIAVAAAPPVGDALKNTFLPERIDLLKIVTLVGGTVGGYISFAGAHRLLDAGISGKASLPQVSRSAVQGIVVTAAMRYVLFLAALGVAVGVGITATNPAASVFAGAAGNLGLRFFGVVMWIAAITSVIGASYTTVSFFKTLHPAIVRAERWVITALIISSTGIFLLLGNPVGLLIIAGAVNGIILPFALALILVAARKAFIVGDYKHPLWLQVCGWLVVLAMSVMCVLVMKTAAGKLF